MKYLIVSDIHGSASSAKFIVDEFNKNNYDKILCLGDVLYHGPRNDLPEGYAPKEVIALLNPIADKIICVKGNCEAYVDQMVLKFEILDSYDFIYNNKKVHLEHGHFLDKYNGDANIIMSGHTHVPVLEYKNDILYLNPGSITIPKENSQRGYMVLENNEITLYSIFSNDPINKIIIK